MVSLLGTLFSIVLSLVPGGQRSHYVERCLSRGKEGAGWFSLAIKCSGLEIITHWADLVMGLYSTRRGSSVIYHTWKVEMRMYLINSTNDYHSLHLNSQARCFMPISKENEPT